MPRRTYGLRDKVAGVAQNKLIRARVIEILGNTVSVRLTQNASRIYGIRLIGGPVQVGDLVHIDYISGTPVAQAISTHQTIPDNTYHYTPAVTDYNEVAPPSQNPSQSLYAVILYSTADYRAYEFPANSDGLTDALSIATSGDIVVLPPGEFDNNYTIPANVALVGYAIDSSIITGQVTMNNQSEMRNMSIVRTANDATTLIGLVMPSSGTVEVSDVDVNVTQSGSGNAYAISIPAGTASLSFARMYIYANSSGGSGYAIYMNVSYTGNSYGFHASIIASTAVTNDTTNRLGTYGCSMDTDTEHGYTLEGDLAAHNHTHTSGSDVQLMLDDLTDVSVSSPVHGNFLTYDEGTNTWIPTSGSSSIPETYLDDLVDVNVPSPGVGHALLWSGSQWTSGSVGSDEGVGLKYRIYLYDESAEQIYSWSPTYSNLTTALSWAAAGDILIWPNVTITGNITVPDGVYIIGLSRELSILEPLGTMLVLRICLL